MLLAQQVEIKFVRSNPCLGVEVHSGLGNWLYIAVEVALAAIAKNSSFALPEFFHAHFHLPYDVRHLNANVICTTIRNMQYTSGSRQLRTEVKRVLKYKSFEHARARMFAHLFGHPRLPKAAFPTVGIAVHLRTVSDFHCHTYTNIRHCSKVCIRDNVLEELQRMLSKTKPRPIVVMSDSRQVAKRFIALFPTQEDIHDEAWIVDASNHSGASADAGHHAMLLWYAFFSANIRVGSSISTFSKSALLALGSKSKSAHNYVVDTRCVKGHHSDGDLFSCRKASLSDLV